MFTLEHHLRLGTCLAFQAWVASLSWANVTLMRQICCQGSSEVCSKLMEIFGLFIKTTYALNLIRVGISMTDVEKAHQSQK